MPFSECFTKRGDVMFGSQYVPLGIKHWCSVSKCKSLFLYSVQTGFLSIGQDVAARYYPAFSQKTLSKPMK